MESDQGFLKTVFDKYAEARVNKQHNDFEEVVTKRVKLEQPGAEERKKRLKVT